PLIGLLHQQEAAVWSLIHAQMVERAVSALCRMALCAAAAMQMAVMMLAILIKKIKNQIKIVIINRTPTRREHHIRILLAQVVVPQTLAVPAWAPADRDDNTVEFMTQFCANKSGLIWPL